MQFPTTKNPIDWQKLRNVDDTKMIEMEKMGEIRFAPEVEWLTLQQYMSVYKRFARDEPLHYPLSDLVKLGTTIIRSNRMGSVDLVTNSKNINNVMY